MKLQFIKLILEGKIFTILLFQLNKKSLKVVYIITEVDIIEVFLHVLSEVNTKKYNVFAPMGRFQLE